MKRKKRKAKIKAQVLELVKGKGWEKRLSKGKMEYVAGFKWHSLVWAVKLLVGYFIGFAKNGRTAIGMVVAGLGVAFIGLHLFLKHRFAGYWTKAPKREPKIKPVPRPESRRIRRG